MKKNDLNILSMRIMIGCYSCQASQAILNVVAYRKLFFGESQITLVPRVYRRIRAFIKRV